MLSRTLIIAACLLTASLAGCADIKGSLAGGKVGDLDGDGDGVPDAAEAQLCARAVVDNALSLANLGSCKGSDWSPIDVSTMAMLPSGATVGPDADSDLLPAYVDVVLVHVTVDVFSSQRLHFGATETLRVTIDTHDDDAESPAPSTLRVKAPIPVAVTMGEDKDGDAFGETLQLRTASVVVDRRMVNDALVEFEPGDVIEAQLDQWDNDPNMPVVSQLEVPVPTKASHTGDGDGDGLVGRIDLGFTILKIDRRDLRNIGHESWELSVTLDKDDADRNNVIPWNVIDDDKDAIVDPVEPVLCLVQDRSSDADGRCVRSDGTGEDGAGENYVPPQLSLLASAFGGDLFAVSTPAALNDLDAEQDDQSVPGPWLGLVVLALLGAAIRRR